MIEKTNPSIEDAITTVFDDGEPNEGVVEEEANFVTYTEESTTNEEEDNLNSILKTTLQKVIQFFSEQADQSTNTFMRNIDTVVADMAPEDRSRVENEILLYFLKPVPLIDYDGIGD